MFIVSDFDGKSRQIIVKNIFKKVVAKMFVFV